jgi:hypothetical protein
MTLPLELAAGAAAGASVAAAAGAAGCSVGAGAQPATIAIASTNVRITLSFFKVFSPQWLLSNRNSRYVKPTKSSFNHLLLLNDLHQASVFTLGKFFHLRHEFGYKQDLDLEGWLAFHNK